jgi:hypothetical protein
MRIASVTAIILFVVAAGFFVYSMVITPRMDSGVQQQGYRRPIQDLTPPKEKDKNAPLQNSNVPPDK